LVFIVRTKVVTALVLTTRRRIMPGSTSLPSEMDYQTYHGTIGSWIPSLILVALLILRYLLQHSIGFQRFVNNQKVHWRKRLGYRDESKYRMGAGDGANTKFERQG
jgi:hypothetical protein